MPWTPENKDRNQIRQRPKGWSEENQFWGAQWPTVPQNQACYWSDDSLCPRTNFSHRKKSSRKQNGLRHRILSTENVFKRCLFLGSVYEASWRERDEQRKATFFMRVS